MAPEVATEPTDNPLWSIDPHELQLGLVHLTRAYQNGRSALRAWLVVRYAEALSRHPDLDGGDVQRCRYQRLAGQWRWLATAGGEVPAVGQGVA